MHNKITNRNFPPDDVTPDPSFPLLSGVLEPPPLGSESTRVHWEMQPVRSAYNVHSCDDSAAGAPFPQHWRLAMKAGKSSTRSASRRSIKGINANTLMVDTTALLSNGCPHVIVGALPNTSAVRSCSSQPKE